MKSRHWLARLQRWLQQPTVEQQALDAIPSDLAFAGVRVRCQGSVIVLGGQVPTLAHRDWLIRQLTAINGASQVSADHLVALAPGGEYPSSTGAAEELEVLDPVQLGGKLGLEAFTVAQQVATQTGSTLSAAVAEQERALLEPARTHLERIYRAFVQIPPAPVSWQRRLEQAQQEYQAARDRYQAAFSQLEALVWTVQADITAASTTPMDDSQRTALAPWLKGLDMVLRQITALPERRKTFTEPNHTPLPADQPLPPPPSLPRLADLVVSQGLPGTTGALRTVMESYARQLAEIRRQQLDAWRRQISQQSREAQELERELDRFLRDYVLPVVDGLERGAGQRLPEGLTDNVVRHVGGLYPRLLRRLKDFLNALGVEPVPAQRGGRFDEAEQECVALQSDPELPPEHICAVQRQGYRHQGRLLRPAQVVVTAPAA
ncbi:MAG: nucleotide exchange factor GrpE [Deinococcus sp.]|nr:nucleotide exchange factor GrpE [Deinococcus sp.]